MRRLLIIILAVIIPFFLTRCKKDKNDDNNNSVPTTVTDIDGNVYNIVTIGTQVWMKENLKVTHYRNGDEIPNIKDSITWQNLTTGAYCDYDTIPSNSFYYGRLYNWFAVSDSRNIAPTGWHVPNDTEWTTLTTYLGGDSVAGGELKNVTGFAALMGGGRLTYGTFFGIAEFGIWWSSTEYSPDNAWHRSLYLFDSTVCRTSSIKTSGSSIRCIKD